MIIVEDVYIDLVIFEFSESYLKLFNIGVMFDVLICYKGKMIGIFCCEYIGGVRYWSEDECLFIGVLVDLYGRVLLV